MDFYENVKKIGIKIEHLTNFFVLYIKTRDFKNHRFGVLKQDLYTVWAENNEIVLRCWVTLKP